MTTGHAGYVKLQAWVKQELWEELNSQGITSPTSAVTQGLQMLLDTTRNTTANTTNNYQGTPALKATIEGLQLLLQEKDERITDLKNENNRLDFYAQYFKSQDYKRLEQPVEEVKVNVQEPVKSAASTPGEARARKDIIKKICKNCGEEFETTNSKKETCSAKCRTAYFRKSRK